MNTPSKLDLLRLARELTESTDIDQLIATANKISQHIGIPGVTPLTPEFKPDFVDFLNRLQIQHPTMGTIPLRLFDFQKEVAGKMQENRFLAINHARQMGISTLSAAYVLWYAMYHPNKTIMIQSNSYSQALEIMERVRFMYESIVELKQGLVEYSKGNILFINGSRILARAVSESSHRGLALDLIVLDQAAYVSHSKAEAYWLSLQPLLATGARMIITSTPHDVVGLFSDVWHRAPANGFATITLPYALHPDRNEEWATVTRNQIGDIAFRREYLCEFVKS